MELSIKQKIIFGIIGIVFCIVIGMYMYNRNKDLSYEEISDIEDNIFVRESMVDKKEIVVHITGAIKVEGIVRLKEGQRIADAIQLAGGELPDADLSRINLAYALEDGEKIYIPSIHDKKSEEENKNEEYIDTDNENNINVKNEIKKGGSLVNINSATQTELESLPGIGASTAAKIIAHRQQNGKFDNIEDLKQVKGIGDAKYENIKNYIKVK